MDSKKVQRELEKMHSDTEKKIKKVEKFYHRPDGKIVLVPRPSAVVSAQGEHQSQQHYFDRFGQCDYCRQWREQATGPYCPVNA